MKRKKLKALGASVLLSGLFALASCSFFPFGTAAVQCYWELEPVEEVNFHTEAQTAYLMDDYTNIGKYASGTAELSRPEAVRLEWSAAPQKNDVTVEEYTLEISSASDFSDKITYYTTDNYANVYNLCIDTDYYWRVTASLSNGETNKSGTSVFYTEGSAPRNLYVDGVTNMRDLGGWETSDGSRVNQGLIYRCGRLNRSESDEVVVEITEEGKKTMLETLGVRSEIDLRKTDNNEVGSITSSPLGEEVNYFSCPMEWNVSNILTANADIVKEIFSILAQEENYPVIYHCNIGTDRTGLIAFLVNGLMGVSEDDLYRDYLFSNFGNIGGSRSLSGIQNSYVATIKSYGGATLSEKINNCLVALGVSQSDIQSVCDILSAN